MQVASQILGKEGAPSWFSGAHVGDMRNVRTSDAAIANPRPPRMTEQPAQDDGRPSSRNSSINFSYPSRVRLGAAASAASAAPEAAQMPPDETRVKRTSSRASSVKSSRHRSSGSTQSLVYDPNSRRMVPLYESSPADENEKITAGKAGKKQKGAHTAPHPRPPKQTAKRNKDAGPSHKGEADRKTQQAPAPQQQPLKQAEQAAPQGTAFYGYEEEPAVKTSATPATLNARRTEHQWPQEANSPGKDESAASALSPLPRDTNRAAQQSIRRQPSVVREEPELEEDVDEEKKVSDQLSASAAVDAIPTKHKVFAPQEQPAPPQHVVEDSGPVNHAASPPPRHEPVELPGEPVSASEDVKKLEAKQAPAQAPARTEAKAVNFRPDREHSNSPVRTARFGTVRDNPSVKYSPPPRAVSPRKSALKQHSPCRTASASPDGDNSEASGSAHLGGGGGGSGEEQPVARKKSVRVSFDDANNVVVGQSASSNGHEPSSTSFSTAGPQNAPGRRHWYSNITRPKKSEFAGLDDDEVMKPRPVLPSFGSVREKKPRGEAQSAEEERPLVRPYASRGDADVAAVDSSAGSTAESLIQQTASDQRRRNAANISRFREPLPPVVTSVDNNSFMSDSSSSDSEQEASGLETIDESPLPTPSQTDENIAAASRESEMERSEMEAASECPIQPSKQGDGNSKKNFYGDSGVESASATIASGSGISPERSIELPGGFPQDESDGPNRNTESTPTDTGYAAPKPSSNLPQPSVASPAADAPADDDTSDASDTDDSGSSVYSDAYEDLPDDQGGGFLSLDAIVDSPMAPRNTRSTPTQRPSSMHVPPSADSSKTEPARAIPAATTNRHSVQGTPDRQPEPRHEVTPPMSVPDFSSASTLTESQQRPIHPEDDWQRAKAFLRSLSVEKRAQLEREAREEEGTEGDLERSPSREPQKPKKKKKVVGRKNIDQKPPSVRLAQQLMAEQRQQQSGRTNLPPSYSEAERSYSIEPGTKVEDDFVLEPSHEVPPMRRTMRGSAPSGAPLSRNTPPRGVPGASSKIPKDNKEQLSTRPAFKRNPRGATPTGSVPALLPTALQRRGSADSESSFKRSRPGTSSAQGLGFKRTMRPLSSSASNDGDTGRPVSRRFSIRSLSPVGSAFSRSSPPSSASGMRQTLRGASSEGRRAGGSPRTERQGKKSVSGISSLKSKLGGSSKASSRFADSSDEEDVATQSKTRFRSRFADSSDEEDAGPQQPRRPMTAPARRSSLLSRGKVSDDRLEPGGGGDDQTYMASPALPEELEDLKEAPESEEEQQATQSQLAGSQSTTLPMAAATATGSTAAPPRKDGGLRRSRSGRGGLAGSRTAPEVGSKKRRSLMGALRRKKTDVGGRSEGGIHRPEMMDSAARRDTRLERSASELMGIRADSPEEPEQQQQQQQQQQPQSPKLHKRMTLPTMDWPLPGHQQDQQDRESTASQQHYPGPSSSLGTRTLSNPPAAAVGHAATASAAGSQRSVSYGTLDVSRTGTGERAKKKKFSTLRRMFGLHD